MRTLVSGLALGCKYALVALGFVIVFKATGVINFAQASFVLVVGYITFNATNTWGINFYLALAVAMLNGAVLGMPIEALILPHVRSEAGRVGERGGGSVYGQCWMVPLTH